MVTVETPQNAGMAEVVVWTITAIAAINLGAIGAMDTNLLAELLEPELLRVVYIVIGVAGLVDVIDLWTSERLLRGS
jgi:uncharacterized membrane protein YuzA (DUF378 family)